MSIGSRRSGLEQAAHRHRRRRSAATNQIPICPGSRVEDAGGRVFQHFEIVVLADDAAQCPQIVRGAEHHDVCEELQRIGKRAFGFFEPYDAASNLQQFEGFLAALSSHADDVVHLADISGSHGISGEADRHALARRPRHGRALGVCRQLPPQPREPLIIAIKSDPFAAPFDRERREPGIRDARPPDIGLDTEASEDVPVALARLDNLAVGLPEKIFAEPERFVDRARHPESARVGGDPHQRAQHQRRYSETRITRYHCGQPGAADPVLRNVPAKGVNQDIHIGQDHLRFLIRRMYSKSSISWIFDRSVSSTPGIGPPVALLTRGRTRLALVCFCFSVKIDRSPSSIRDVRVRPSAAALRLARLRRSSGSRTVVRSVICHDIS